MSYCVIQRNEEKKLKHFSHFGFNAVGHVIKRNPNMKRHKTNCESFDENLMRNMET